MAAIIRQEINLLTRTPVNVSDANNFIVQLDTTQYVNPTYYFEIQGGSGTLGNISLRRVGTTTDDATFSDRDTGVLHRTTFTPPAGQTQYMVNTTSTWLPKIARIVIIDNPTTLTSSETQIEIGSASSITSTTQVALTNPKYWQYVAANWDGTKTFYCEATADSPSTKTPGTMVLQTSTSITAPSWSDVASSTLTFASTTAIRQRSGSIALTDGNWYRFTAGNNVSTKSTMHVYNAKIIIDQSSSPTKLEPQYLLANTLFAAGTGLQTFLTNWDTTEWSGVTNAYTFQAEAADNSTSDIELWAADGSGSALATVTNADNAGQGSATLGTTKNLDVKATTNAGDVAAARILVAVSVNAATATAAITGTLTPTATEADIVAGSKTVIITLTGDTWIADITAQRQNIINGHNSAQSETHGWNNEVRAKQAVGEIVRTSDTVVTNTVAAQAAYDITASETITVTVPATALTGGVTIVATPTFQINPTGLGGATGFMTMNTSFWGN